MAPPISSFSTVTRLKTRIQNYFTYIEGQYHLEEQPGKDGSMVSIKIYDREPEPPTVSALAYHLGFNSRDEFFSYELKGKFAGALKRARLRIEMAYEKKLHQQSPSGALFALKNMGWNEKPKAPGTTIPASFKIELLDQGPMPAWNEKEVVLG